MEKFFIIRLISIVIVFMPTFALAQDDEPAIKIKTETYDGGITVDTYEKGSEEYRHIKKKNGDFYIESMAMNYPIRWTLKDGTLIEGNRKELRINLYGKGDVLITSDLIYLRDFTNAEKTTPELLEGLDKRDFKGFIRPNEPDKILPFSCEGFIGSCGERESFLTLANCLYTIDNNGKMKFIGKKSKMKSGSDNKYAYVYAIPTDSIIDCEEMECKNGFFTKISYANGDEVIIERGVNGGLSNGTHIHRENGVLKVINDFYYFYFNDGRIFKGKMNNCFKEIFDPHKWSNTLMNSKVLSYPSLTPYTGTLINKDNTGVVIEEGMTQEEREKQSELARKKEEANKKAGYNILCKTYGKKYVDAAMNGKVIVGMPQDLFLLTFPITRLRSQTQSTKVYEVRNILNRIIKVVRVTNGRVSKVTNY